MKYEMIKREKEFFFIYKNGKTFANKFFIIHYVKNNEKKLKIGISISKKVGNAVTRNRIRRLIKENIRLSNNIKEGYSIIFSVRFAKKEGKVTSVEKINVMEKYNFNQVKKEMTHVLKKRDLLNGF